MSDNQPKPADRAEITVLVDNYTDIFVPQKTPVDRRLPFDTGRHLLAEHGLSCLVRVFSGKKEHTILLDAGLSRECFAWNARQLGIPLSSIGAVVLSHGHFDHTGGLESVFSRAGRPIPLFTHPDAFLRRRLNVPARGYVELPRLDAVELKKAGADLRMHREPASLAGGYLIVTGEVERCIPFETGMPGMEMDQDGLWVTDPIADDQAIVINVNDKGLVVISGCAHAGIINTVEQARKITGIQKVHAVLGGFHLTGPAFASRIAPTIGAMKKLGPDYLVPMHCTGWGAVNRFMEAMPKPFILNTVGTTYVF